MISSTIFFRSRTPGATRLSGRRAFTLVELLVVITIIGILVSLSMVGMQKVFQLSTRTKAVSDLRSVIQSCLLYAGDNNGDILVPPTSVDPGSAVSESFWGRLQPFIFDGINHTDEADLRTQLEQRLRDFYDVGDLQDAPGGLFNGAPRFTDASGLVIPFAFNSYLGQRAPGVFRKTQQVDSAANTIYVAYGNGTFTEADGATYAEPSGGSTDTLFYLPNKQAILGYLDGRADLKAAPLDAELFTID